MAAILHYRYHETDESRVFRELWNEANTGEKGSNEDVAARIELPTSAGSALLDLGQSGGISPSMGRRGSIHVRHPGSLPKRNSTGPGSGDSRGEQVQRPSRDSSMLHTEGIGMSGKSGAPHGLHFDEDLGPPLNAEDAKARATRTAMLIEYKHRRETAKTSDSKYDILLSA